MWLLLVMILVMPFEMNPYLYLHPNFLGIIPDFTVIKLLGMVGFVWALLKVVTRDSGPIFNSPQARLFVALFSGIVISAVLNESPLGAVTKYLVFVLFMPFVISTVRTQDNLRRVMYFLGFTMVIVVPYALRQTGRYPGRMGVGIYEPNYFAANLLLLLPIPFAIASYQTIRWKRYSWLAAGAVLVLGLIMTSSRGGYLGLLVAGIVYAYRRKGLWGAVGVLALLVAVALPTDLGGRAVATLDADAPAVPGLQESNAAHRALFWGGLRMMMDAPLFGVGPQRFKDYSRLYSGLSISYIAHNTYLELAAEAGLPVLLLFLFICLTAVVVLGRAAKITGGPEARELAAWADALRTGIIGFVVSAGFISAQFEKFFWLIIFLSIVIGRLAARQAARESTEDLAALPVEPMPAAPPRSPRFA